MRTLLLFAFLSSFSSHSLFLPTSRKTRQMIVYYEGRGTVSKRTLESDSRRWVRGRRHEPACRRQTPLLRRLRRHSRLRCLRSRCRRGRVAGEMGYPVGGSRSGGGTIVRRSSWRRHSSVRYLGEGIRSGGVAGEVGKLSVSENVGVVQSWSGCWWFSWWMFSREGACGRHIRLWRSLFRCCVLLLLWWWRWWWWSMLGSVYSVGSRSSGLAVCYCSRFHGGCL